MEKFLIGILGTGGGVSYRRWARSSICHCRRTETNPKAVEGFEKKTSLKRMIKGTLTMGLGRSLQSSTVEFSLCGFRFFALFQDTLAAGFSGAEQTARRDAHDI